MGSSAFVDPSLSDYAGRRATVSALGDVIVGSRRSVISTRFNFDLEATDAIKETLYDLTNIVGTFTAGELVRGQTSGATGYIITTATPALIGEDSPDPFLAGETITGVVSGATATINPTVGSGTAQVTNNVLNIITGTNATDEVNVRSRLPIRALVGHDLYGAFTLRWTAVPPAGTNIRAGLLSRDDGFWLGYTGSTFQVGRRRGGTDVDVVNQANWNLDPLDGTGPSGFTLDTTKFNVYMIQMGSTGASPALFLVQSPDGKWIPFHRFRIPGTLTTPSLVNTHLRPSLISTKTAGATSSTLECISWAAGSLELSADPYAVDVSSRIHSHYYLYQTPSAVNNVPMISYRVSHLYDGVLNEIPLDFQKFLISPDQRNAVIRAYLDADLTGAAFTPYNGESVMEVDTSATAFTGGRLLMARSVKRDQTEPFDIRPIELYLLRGHTLTLTAKTGGLDDIHITSIWRELF